MLYVIDIDKHIYIYIYTWIHIYGQRRGVSEERPHRPPSRPGHRLAWKVRADAIRAPATRVVETLVCCCLHLCDLVCLSIVCLRIDLLPELRRRSAATSLIITSQTESLRVEFPGGLPVCCGTSPLENKKIPIESNPQTRRILVQQILIMIA